MQNKYTKIAHCQEPEMNSVQNINNENIQDHQKNLCISYNVSS